MRRIQFESLVVTEWDVETFPLQRHKHSFYEMIYIREGQGVHVLNNNYFPYQSGDIFIVSPEDQHFFEIEKRTKFTFIKFTDSYFAKHKQHGPDAVFFSSARRNYVQQIIERAEARDGRDQWLHFAQYDR